MSLFNIDSNSLFALQKLRQNIDDSKNFDENVFEQKVFVIFELWHKVSFTARSEQAYKGRSPPQKYN